MVSFGCCIRLFFSFICDWLFVLTSEGIGGIFRHKNMRVEMLQRVICLSRQSLKQFSKRSCLECGSAACSDGIGSQQMDVGGNR